MENNNPDIIALTELFPKNYLFGPDSGHFKIGGYELNISVSKAGRGVYIYTKLSLNRTILDFNTDFQDQVLCQIKLHDNDKLIVGYINVLDNNSRV